METTRKIKKLVLTGGENYTYNSAYTRFVFTISDIVSTGTARTNELLCSHYDCIYDGRSISNVPNNSIYCGTGTDTYIKTTEYNDVTDFKTYLQQQYAAGTPVTIWYVLSSATTGIVNEPLRKIGDYADSVTSELSGIQIPTIVGDNTISVDTTLQPSEMQIVYKIADR